MLWSRTLLTFLDQFHDANSMSLEFSVLKDLIEILESKSSLIEEAGSLQCLQSNWVLMRRSSDYLFMDSFSRTIDVTVFFVLSLGYFFVRICRWMYFVKLILLTSF
ncbi:hypothetical protein S245_023148 [Arachis hypogaea]